MQATRQLAALAFLVLLPGCGYSLRPPFDREIRTVFVNFKSQSFRRDVNIELTQMVQDEIRLRTPYRVVSDPDEADVLLEGTITYVDKNVQVENPNNLPRHLLSSVTAVVKVTDKRAMTQNMPKIPSVSVGEMSPFYGEIGETASLGYEKTLQKMARDIVSMMEKPWGEEYRNDIDLPEFDPEAVPIEAPRRRRGDSMGAKIPATDGPRR